MLSYGRADWRETADVAATAVGQTRTAKRRSRRSKARTGGGGVYFHLDMLRCLDVATQQVEEVVNNIETARRMLVDVNLEPEPRSESAPRARSVVRDLDARPLQKKHGLWLSEKTDVIRMHTDDERGVTTGSDMECWKYDHEEVQQAVRCIKPARPHRDGGSLDWMPSLDRSGVSPRRGGESPTQAPVAAREAGR